MSFLLPLWLIGLIADLTVQYFVFGSLLWISFFTGYSVPFMSYKKLTFRLTVDSRHSLIFYALLIVGVLAALYKVIAIGLPVFGGVSGRNYEEQFMTTGRLSTVFFLFLPVIAAACVLRLNCFMFQGAAAVLISLVILIPGVKGNVFLFVFILLWSHFVTTKLTVNRAALVTLSVAFVTFCLFLVSHFFLREQRDFSNVGGIALEVLNLILGYIYPNFINLALTIENSNVFQFGGVFLLPIVDQLSLGTLRTVSADGQIWYFFDPAYKAGTWARDFWQDFGWFGIVFAFFLGLIWGAVQLAVFRVESRSAVPLVATSLMSFPIAFMFFYNEFNRSQVVFGLALVVFLYSVPRFGLRRFER